MKILISLLGLSLIMLLSLPLKASEGCEITSVTVLPDYQPKCSDNGSYFLGLKVEAQNLPPTMDDLFVQINYHESEVCEDGDDPNVWYLLICNLRPGTGNADVYVRAASGCDFTVLNLFDIPSCGVETEELPALGKWSLTILGLCIGLFGILGIRRLI